MRAWMGWLTAAVVGAAPVALGSTVVQPRARLSFEERFDDDFRLNVDGRSGGQLMTKLSPRVGLDAKDPSLTLTSFYAADLLARHGSGRVTLDHRGGFTVRKLLTRQLRVDVSGSIFRVTDPTSLPRESVARTNQPVLYGTSRVYVTQRLTRRVDLGAGYGFEGVQVLEAGTLPGFVHTPYVEAWLRATRRLTLGVEYRYQAFLYGDNLDQGHGAFGALRYRLTRRLTTTVRGGPVLFLGQDGRQGVLPRVKLETLYEAGRFDMGAIAGHDLVGASGFANALWADYAGLTFNHRFSQRFNLYGAASLFRNGRAPGEDVFRLQGGERVSQGYALSAGFEFKVNRYLSMQAAVDRISQVGVSPAATAAGVNLTRNVGAVRLHMTAW